MARTEAYREIVESQLERMDDQAADSAAEPEPSEHLEPDPYGFHVDDPDLDLLDDDLDAGLRDDVEADALDAIADAFNARDLEGLLETIAVDGEVPGILGYERSNLADAVERLWSVRPNVCLTRGRAGIEHVGVLWEHDGEQWYRIAVVHVDDVDDHAAGVVEVSEDAALLERVLAEPPDDELEQGGRWEEWDEGAGS